MAKEESFPSSSSTHLSHSKIQYLPATHDPNLAPHLRNKSPIVIHLPVGNNSSAHGSIPVESLATGVTRSADDKGREEGAIAVEDAASGADFALDKGGLALDLELDPDDGLAGLEGGLNLGRWGGCGSRGGEGDEEGGEEVFELHFDSWRW